MDVAAYSTALLLTEVSKTVSQILYSCLWVEVDRNGRVVGVDTTNLFLCAPFTPPACRGTPTSYVCTVLNDIYTRFVSFRVHFWYTVSMHVAYAIE